MPMPMPIQEPAAAAPPPVPPTAAEAHAGNGKPSKAADKPKTAHQECVETWMKWWAEQCGSPYPFTSRDGKAVKDMLKTLGNRHVVLEYMENFLYSQKPYYAGWPLGKLVANLPEFARDPRVPLDAPHG